MVPREDIARRGKDMISLAGAGPPIVLRRLWPRTEVMGDPSTASAAANKP